MSKTIILKPVWGTAAVYKVLDNEIVIHNLGRFTRANLANIWHEEQYTNMHDELLQLMMRFQLCYKIPDSDEIYIAPQLLTENQPDYQWPERNNLLLCYSYEFMPKGILSRFIVTMHKFITDQQCVWRSGVVLEKDQTKAEIIEDYNKHRIRIRVTGDSKKELLTLVMYELDKIHDSYKRLKNRYNKLIPCNCIMCKNNQEPHFYPYEVLRRFKANGNPIQCQESGQMVNVQELIDDVIDRSHTSIRQKEVEYELQSSVDTISRRKDIKKLLIIYYRRLQLVKEKQARYGLNKPTELILEGEDIKDEIKKLEDELNQMAALKYTYTITK